MHQSDTQGWIRLTLLMLLLLAFFGYCIIEAGTTETANPATPTQTPQETQAPTKPTCTIPTRQETPPQTKPPTSATEPPTEPTQTQSPTVPTEVWQSLGSYRLTAYCACEKCCGRWATTRPTDENGNPIVYTASGAIAKAGTTIAVDPSIIPYGTTVKINDHIYIAQDTGGSIKGNRIDIYYEDHQQALNFGLQEAEVFLQTEPS